MKRPLALLLQNRLGCAGLVLVLLIVLSAAFADALAPFDPVAISVKDRLQGPSSIHWLGTDQLGRDIFSRMIAGGRVALGIALPSIFAALALGILLGMIAGFGPRRLDAAILFLFDTVRSFPTVMFALAVVALIGPGLVTVMLVVVATSTPVYGRVARTQTLALKSAPFILAGRAMGASPARLLGVHILPNIAGPLLILASMDIPAVIALEAGLSFLGMGVKPPTPSWGSILNDGYALIRNTPWLVVAGGLPLIAATLGFTFLGEALRDIFDPKLRGAR